MKYKILHIYMQAVAMLLLIGSFTPAAIASDKGLEINGVVKNARNNRNIGHADIVVTGTNITTLSNEDGVFTLKIPSYARNSNISVRRLGYFSADIPLDSISNIKSQIVIKLVPAGKILDEVTVRGGDPREIVEEAFGRVKKNYSDHKTLSTAFYRETVQKGSRFIGITEGIVDVAKNPYGYMNFETDKVKLRKGRRLLSQKASDTIAVKMVGGPTLAVYLDFIKNHDALFDPSEMNFYEFTMLDPVLIDDRNHFAIKFRPVHKQDYVMMEGVLYIDQENLTISRGEYKMDMSDKDKVTRAMLLKKPSGLRFSPQECSYTVTYRTDDNRLSHLQYVGVKSRFKCDWKRRLFSSGYTINSEMVMVDRDDEPTEDIKRKDAFGRRDVFYDLVENYWDPDFWKDYNIIEPTVSLEKAIDKLKNVKESK